VLVGCLMREGISDAGLNLSRRKRRRKGGRNCRGHQKHPSASTLSLKIGLIYISCPIFRQDQNSRNLQRDVLLSDILFKSDPYMSLLTTEGSTCRHVRCAACFIRRAQLLRTAVSYKAVVTPLADHRFEDVAQFGGCRRR